VVRQATVWRVTAPPAKYAPPPMDMKHRCFVSNMMKIVLEPQPSHTWLTDVEILLRDCDANSHRFHKVQWKRTFPVWIVCSDWNTRVKSVVPAYLCTLASSEFIYWPSAPPTKSRPDCQAGCWTRLPKWLWFLVHGQVTIIFVVSVGLSVCLFVCAEFFSAVFDPISIKLGHMLYVWV